MQGDKICAENASPIFLLNEGACTEKNILDKSYKLVKHFPDFPLWEYRIASFLN